MFQIEDATKKNYFSLFPEELIASILDAFIINQPMSGKVGGDGFYVHQDPDHLFVVVFDCMGHGHLASMMTRIYTHFLEEIIKDEGVKDPGTILKALHERIQSKFVEKRNQVVGTGADVGVLKINLAVRGIEFAGAKMNLIQVRNGELMTIKSDRIQLGELFDYEHTYSTKKVELGGLDKSNFYLMTDGFRDLIGGPDERKLGSRRVNELLSEVYESTMMNQKEILLKQIEEWGGSNMRVDDLLVIGFSL